MTDETRFITVAARADKPVYSGKVPENANGHERQGARTSGVTHRNRGRPIAEPYGVNATKHYIGMVCLLCKTVIGNR